MIKIGNIPVDRSQGLVVLCGPCVVESLAHARMMAERIAEAGEKTGVRIIYKSSFEKANRTSAGSYRGLGREEGLSILSEVRKEFGLPLVSDVHNESDAEVAGKVLDLVQIPAFLCRQTDLLLAAAATLKPVMIKKGQFVAPQDMKFAAAKIVSAGNPQVLLCERGACFGYRDLVVDFRSLAIMRSHGFPVVFDATHSVQQMGGDAGRSSGAREYVPPLARAAVAFGVDAVFLETHENPDAAPSDGPNMLPIALLQPLLRDLRSLHELALETRVGFSG